MIRAILIESKRRTISAFDLPDAVPGSGAQLLAIQDKVGGYIERVHTFPNGDLLLVNDDGGHLVGAGEFTVYGLSTVFRGDAVIVGGPDRQGDITSTRLAVESVGAFIRFPT